MTPTLDILFQDDHLIAVNKPHGLLVHRTGMAADATEFALQLVRDQVGRFIYTIHRLDRKTGGALLFAFDEDTLRSMQHMFASRLIHKSYLAIVRGHTDDSGVIDYPLKNDRDIIQQAITKYHTLDRSEIDVPFGKHPTSRYSLLEVLPETGRFHQIRKHLAHMDHPIIADRPHGCNKQNKLFLEKFGMDTMMLHAAEVSFVHPHHGNPVLIQAPLHLEFRRMIDLLGFSPLTGRFV